MLTHSIAFVLGFSFVFITLGISSSMIGQFLSTYQTYISRIGGILLIVMGLFSLNLIKIPFLNQEKMIQLKKKPLGFFGSFIVGIAFSLGWTPCIGPALSSILIIASTEESTRQGRISAQYVFTGICHSIYPVSPSFRSVIRISQTIWLSSSNIP